MDERHMRRALSLAAAVGSVSPRPAVGAVVVDASGEVVGEGATAAAPGPHAEVAALRQAGARAAGATVYVTLEPCSHEGDTPPCVRALIDAGVARVVAATSDPNPSVDGFGPLKAAGIQIVTGVCEDDARAQIAGFARWVRTGRPLVTLKLAATLDGKIAAPDGSSRWITGPEARREVHEMRRRADGVLVGAGTVAADDPALTCRLDGYDGRQPVRIVVDTSGRTPVTAQVFDGRALVTIVTTPGVAHGQWSRAGAEVIEVPAADGGADLGALLDELGRRGMCDVLCEGGPTLGSSLVAGGLVDRLVIYLGAKLVGGDAPSLLTSGVKSIDDAWPVEITSVTRVGDDIRIDAKLRAG